MAGGPAAGGNGLGGFSAIKPPNGEFFLQNDVRSVDLTEEEKVLLSLQSQEVDALRVISMIPIGTELYRYKMEQYKELSNTRAEIEKIVQEQRLQRLRREFEKQRRDEDRKFENERWIDEQRKNIIAQRIRKDLNPGKTLERKYDPSEGFLVHWDYCLGLPKSEDYASIVYGIYNNGETIFSPTNISPHFCDNESSKTKMCIFGEKSEMQEIPANPTTLMIWEIQSSNSSEPGGSQVSLGYTMIDLFDARRELRFV
jgi:hypothetical protein